MSLRVESADALFSWLNAEGVRYVVLRDFDRIDQIGNRPDRDQDIDLLIDDAAIPAMENRFGKPKRRRGVKCDIYGVRGEHGSDYLGHPHLPVALGERMLERRLPYSNRFHVPEAQDHLAGLLYHLVYHKNLQSGLHWHDPEDSRNSPYVSTISKLTSELGLDLPLTHEGFHAYLGKIGFGVTKARLIAYIQRDFRYGRKVYFHALVQNELPGEMNLFVIRKIARKKEKHGDLLAFLGAKFEILMTKDIPWRTAFRLGKQMRGGKWRRGGKPCIAAVVFDPDPVPTSAADRAVHSFVFNRNQFVKQEWRVWFAANTNARPKDNPIHSTDNEAEAIGHLPLFFTPEEQRELFQMVDERRGNAGFAATDDESR